MLTVKTIFHDGTINIREAKSVSQHPTLTPKTWVWWIDEAIEIGVDNYAVMFVMNDTGATIETLRQRKPDAPDG